MAGEDEMFSKKRVRLHQQRRISSYVTKFRVYIKFKYDLLLHVQV